MVRLLSLLMCCSVFFLGATGCSVVGLQQEPARHTAQASETPSTAVQDIKDKEKEAHSLNTKAINFTLWSWQLHDGFIAGNYADLIKEYGYDGVDFCVRWDRIEPSRGVYDWTYLDSVLDSIIERDLKLSVSVLFWSAGLSWKDELEWQQDANGKVYVYDDMRGSFINLHNQKNIDTIKDTVKAFGKHVNEKYGKHVTRWHVRTSCYGELEYSPDTDLDYSPTALQAFYTYLEQKYKDVNGFNADYQSGISSWSELGSLEAKELTTLGAYDWKRFKQDTIIKIARMTTDILHEINPQIPVALQVGSLWDTLAASKRGVFDPYLVSRDVDILHIDDAPFWPHDFSIDMAQSLAPGKLTAMEIDGAQHASAIPDAYLRQARMCGEGGINFLNTANWSYDNLSYYGPDLLSKYPGLFSNAEVRPAGEASKAILYPVTDFICAKTPAALSDSLFTTYNRLSDNGKKKVRFITDSMLLENKNLLDGEISELYLGQLDHFTYMTEEFARILADSNCSLIGDGAQRTRFVNPYGKPLDPEIVQALKDKIKQ